jgi:DNA-binding transcriptional LysR family regulator
MIVEMYRLQDLDLVAEHFNLTRSAVSKRFKIIHRIVGPLFDFTKTKEGAIPLAHTSGMVRELEKSLKHAYLAAAMSAADFEGAGRVRVNLAAPEHIETMLVQPLKDRLKDASRIQVQYNLTSANLLSDRMQNLDIMCRMLERGDIDILLCYDFERQGVSSQQTLLSRIPGMRARGLLDSKSACMVNKNASVSDPMTEEELKKMKRAVSIPEFPGGAMDFAFVYTSLHSASLDIQADPGMVCIPSEPVARHFAKLYDLKVVRAPQSEESIRPVKMLWAEQTDDNFACKAVRSAIIRYFAEI